MAEALEVLSPVKASFKDLSWADLIALAGKQSSLNFDNSSFKR
jgi:catalase (peroxidase I)